MTDLEKVRDKIDYQWIEAGATRIEATHKYTSAANILNLAMKHHQQHGGTAMHDAIKLLKSAHVTAEMEMEIAGARERALEDCLAIIKATEGEELATIQSRARTDAASSDDGVERGGEDEAR